MMSNNNPFSAIRAAEHNEYERLSAYLGQLDADGWQETSYCADWPVLRVISHLSSSAVINGGRLAAWFQGRPPMAREEFPKLWAHYDSLTAEQMLPEFRQATDEYFKVFDALTEDHGATEVEGFMGKQPANRYIMGRLNEMALHAWDVYVGRDRRARLTQETVGLLLPVQRAVSLDRQRAEKLAGKKVQFRTVGPSDSLVLDLTGEQPALTHGEGASPDVSLELPAEEFCRLMYGRQFVPGTRSGMILRAGSPDDQSALLRAFR
ncbi:MAG: maleylpyruvate isomerase family mycothiol-dependent enzyme [Chloroflexota bacterium]|nr:maleylpyruvate isomerase family mycothiol-dependent enzyme [Chloroflexota bacterium]